MECLPTLNAANFSGDGLLAAPDSASLSKGDVDFTLAAWVYLDDLPSQVPFVAKWDFGNTDREYEMQYAQPPTTNVTGPSLRFLVSSDGNTGASTAWANWTSGVQTGQWFFMVGWHDSVNDTVNLQVNNSGIVSSGFADGVNSGASDLIVGAAGTSGAPTAFLDGRVSRVGLWDKVLTSDERSQLYNNGCGLLYDELNASLLTGLASYWNLGEVSGTRSDSEGSNDLTDILNNVSTAPPPCPFASGCPDLFLHGHEQISGGMDLFLKAPVPISGLIDLSVTGIEELQDNLELFVQGIIPNEELSCTPVSTSGSIVIPDSLIDIFQGRIDALINQIGKNVTLVFDAGKEVCPNCEFDPIRNRSSGRPKSGGPRPFRLGRPCPYCKGRGFVETQNQKCIKALTRWNPRDAIQYGIVVRRNKDIVRLKTFTTDYDDLVRASYAITNADIASVDRFRVRLKQAPIVTGLRESRYCISFWERV